MGYTVATLNKNGEDTTEILLTMLRAATKNTKHTIGVANHRDTETTNSPEYTSITGPILLGKRNIFSARYPPEPLHQGNHSLTFNGLLLDTKEPDTLSAANELRASPEKGIKKLLTERTGAYTITTVTADSILAGVDYIGTVPLYYGENSETKAISSNKKPLWVIGIEPTPVKPGQIIKITEKDTIVTQAKTFERKPTRLANFEDLHAIMKKTAQSYANKTPGATVAFSGGIDSTLTAYYLQENNLTPELIWTGLENQREITTAQQTADHLGLKLHIDAHTLEEVEETLKAIITSTEDPDPVKTGIAYPFHWAAKKTNNLGYTTMYSGNGADELFGGYKRYHEKYLKGGDPTEDIYNDVANSYLQNFHRDHKVCIDQEVRLLLPFTHPRIVEYGLTIQITQKLPRTEDQPRKKILRELAKNLGLPDNIAERPKRAAQYSSGVNKTLVKLAKRKDVSLREYTSQRYNEIKEEISRV